MIKRKLQKIGRRSFFITLPKKWVEENRIKEKDILNIEITKNNNLLISINQEQNKNMELNIGEREYLPNLIFLCYYKNIKEIIFRKKFSIDEKKIIKKTLNILNDYKIIEESDDMIKIYCSSEYSNINIKKIIIRLIYLIKLSLKALEKKDKTTIEENEIEINRLYHITKKKLMNSIIDSKERELNNIKEIVEIFYLDEIIKKIENIADIIYEMQFIKFSSKSYNVIYEYVNQIEKLFIYNKGLENFIKLINKYTNYNIRLKSIEGKITLICKDIYECLVELKLNEKYFVG